MSKYLQYILQQFFQLRHFQVMQKFFEKNYNQIPFDDKNSIQTTLGQLNFFKWAIENGVINYIENNYSDIESDYLIAMALASQKNLKAIEKSDIDCHGANFFLSDGELAGQEVMHSHMHLTPRLKEDGHRMGFVDTLNSKKADRMKLNEIAAIISSNIVSMAHE